MLLGYVFYPLRKNGSILLIRETGVVIMRHKFLLCIEDKGYEASLEIRKLYCDPS
jgi:hypothetical protein